MQRERIAVWFAYAGMCLIWGTTWLAIKVGLKTLPPLTGVGLRFLIAGAVLYGVAALLRELRPPRELPWKVILVFAALLFGLNYVLVYVAETRLDSGLVAVLFGTMPFFTFIFAHAIMGERMTPRIWIGSLTAFAGVAVISLAGAVKGAPLFVLAAVAAAATAAYANVFAKRHSHYPPLVTLPPAMTITGLAVLALGLVLEKTDWAQALRGSSLIALLYLAILGSSVAFFLMLWVLKRLPASVVSLSTLIFPVIAIIVGALVGGERITARELAGSALVVAGLWIALSRKEARVEERASTPPYVENDPKDTALHDPPGRPSDALYVRPGASCGIQDA